MENDEIRALVKRLSRPGAAGSTTIERAAILANGSDSIAVVDWILDHGGAPEAATSASSSVGGLHGTRISGGNRAHASEPVRYVLPRGTFD